MDAYAEHGSSGRLPEFSRSLEMGTRKRLDRQAYTELRTRRAMAFRNAQAYEAMVVGVFSICVENDVEICCCR
jgi:hypothetical protein